MSDAVAHLKQCAAAVPTWSPDEAAKIDRAFALIEKAGNSTSDAAIALRAEATRLLTHLVHIRMDRESSRD